jgi:hypothetical protein
VIVRVFLALTRTSILLAESAPYLWGHTGQSNCQIPDSVPRFLEMR